MRVRADCTSEQIARFLRGGDVTAPAAGGHVHFAGKSVGGFHLLPKLFDLRILVRYRLQSGFVRVLSRN